MYITVIHLQLVFINEEISSANNDKSLKYKK